MRVYHYLSAVLLFFSSAVIPPTPASADELLGKYSFWESYILPQGEMVSHRLWICLWKVDGSEELIIQFLNSETEDEYYSISFFDDTLMFFEKDNKIYTFDNLLNCNSDILAAGEIWGVRGLWQLSLR